MKDNKYLQILEKWEKNPRAYAGLCHALHMNNITELTNMFLFKPDYRERKKYIHDSAFWGGAIRTPSGTILNYKYLNDFRRNVLCFMAVIK